MQIADIIQENNNITYTK